MEGTTTKVPDPRSLRIPHPRTTLFEYSDGRQDRFLNTESEDLEQFSVPHDHRLAFYTTTLYGYDYGWEEKMRHRACFLYADGRKRYFEHLRDSLPYAVRHGGKNYYKTRDLFVGKYDDHDDLYCECME